MRDLSIGLMVIALTGGGVFLFFIKGLYLLPDKVCDGTVKRDVAIRTLPRTRSADEWADQGGTGRHFSFACRVSTSGDSILSGQVDLRDSPKVAWVDSYGSLAASHVIRVSKGDVEALAQMNGDGSSASVYVPCVPTNVKEGDASHAYALVADAGVTGKSRATGAELRQALTDFAYQLTKHAYELAGCKDPRDFPEELPRYEDG
ncbi:hypothetical protein [Streptomyces sp. NBC_00996]|uniref:hypothetical protein n=1 Tax=Streptomyces sp. NBC_00996 TaxID=2903710 RepID=UPI003867BFC6|nr:hypothetical protein OG390_37395 [Streptomyces sp. NBC_00996]